MYNIFQWPKMISLQEESWRNDYQDNNNNKQLHVSSVLRYVIIGDRIKVRVMGGACNTHGRDKP